MNKRMKNKIEKRRRQQICKVLDLCLQINGLQKSKKECTGDHPTAFFEFSGHVPWVEVDVHKRGWDIGLRPDKKYHAHINHPEELEELIDQLKKETPGAATPRESAK